MFTRFRRGTKRGSRASAHASGHLDFVVALVSEHPLACAKSYRHTRRALVPGFPYALFYTVLSDRVRVLACLHQRRAPSFVKRRLSVDRNPASR